MKTQELRHSSPRPGDGSGREGMTPRICMITYNPQPWWIPSIQHEGLSFVKLGYKCDIICTWQGPDAPKPEKIVEGFDIHRVTMRSRKFFHKRFGVGSPNIAVAAIQYVLSYTEYVAKATVTSYRLNSDIYEAHDLPTLLPGVLASLFRRKPLVYHAHELYSEMHEKVRFASVWRFLERALVPFATEIVTPEENRSRIYVDEYRAKKMPLTLRNCPPYKAGSKGTKIHDHLSAQGYDFKTIVLYQGLVDKSRCIEEVTEAAKLFDRGIGLVILGGGFNSFKSLIHEHPNVVHINWMEYEKLTEYTASADIGILFYRNTCRNNYFCAPNKLHEYMMMGLPMITPRYPGIMKIVEGEHIGRCVDPENVAEIAAAVNAIAADPEDYARMRENCLRLSRDKYNWEIEFEKLRGLYESILGITSGSGRNGTTRDHDMARHPAPEYSSRNL